ncbi:MAG TPA: Bax inhibitor-1 family protein [Candidatus Azoamicus sp. OHIO1]
MQTNIRSLNNLKGESIAFNGSVIGRAYMLLSSTILFSSFVSYLSIVLNVRPVGFIFIVFLLLLSFLINRFKDSKIGLFFVYVLSGFCGYSLGPLVNSTLHIPNGSQMVFGSLILTGVLFSVLSFYAIITKRNLSFLSGFLFIGFLVCLFAVFVNLFFSINVLSLLVSAFIIILSCGWILYDTNSLVNSGETNYVIVTVNLYLQIYNLFSSLLFIIKFFFNKD